MNKISTRKTSEQIKDLLQTRDLDSIKIIDTLYLRPFSSEERARLQIQTVVWQRSTRLFKLAHHFYGDSRLWWVIGWFNQSPTDADYSPGDIVYIPFPLEEITRRIS